MTNPEKKNNDNLRLSVTSGIHATQIRSTWKPMVVSDLVLETLIDIFLIATKVWMAKAGPKLYKH